MADARGLLIFGAGGSGREIASWASRATWEGAGFDVLSLIDDHAPSRELDGFDVLSLADAAARHPGAAVMVAVGDPRLRERLLDQALAAGLVSSPPLVHPGVELDPRRARLGEGVVICPGSIVTVGVEIGPHVQVNVHCSVMHDVTLGAFCTLSPGVQISGNVTLEPYAFMGTGAVTVQGQPGAPLRIGEGAVIGAGAVVTREIPAGVTAVGVPARPLP